MKKLLVVFAVAVAFSLFVYGQEVVEEEFEEDVPDYSSGFSNESSSDSESSSTPPVTSSAFPIDSSSSSSSSFAASSSSSSSALPNASSSAVPPVTSSSALPTTCPDGKYLKNGVCVDCYAMLMCRTCSNGHSCDSCNADSNLNKDGRCVVNCSAKYGDGCTECSNTMCTSCSGSGCCLKLKFYWNSTTNECVQPSEVFGDGCLETDGVKCTKCTAQTCCGDDQYYNFVAKECQSCSLYGDNCAKCVDGSCLTCGENEAVASNGYCVTCGRLYGAGCDECDETECTRAKEGSVIIGTNAVSCSSLFGSSCVSCGENGCLNCSGDYHLFDGYCKSCQEVFGEYCSDCNASACTACTGEGIVNVDGVCVPCDEAFGTGCAQCTADGCDANGAKPGYFVNNKYAFSCDVLPEEANGKHPREACIGGTRRDIDFFAVLRDEENSITVTFDGDDYSVTCAQMMTNCSKCETEGEGDNKQSVCTECEYGILYGKMCKTCSQLYGEQCVECSKSGCTKCSADYNLTIEGKCVQCSGDKPIFDETTKTCVSCGMLFSHCSSCSVEGCTDCTDSYVADDDGKCKTCKAIHGDGCNTCNKTDCIDCKLQDCCSNDTRLIVVNDEVKCGVCSEFDEKCTECTQNECTKCGDAGVVVDVNDHKCKNCSDIFPGCFACDSYVCRGCLDSTWTFTPNGCYYDGDLSSSTPVQSSVHSGSTKPVTPKSSETTEEGGSNAGLIAGIVVACVVLVVILVIVVYCVATAGAKHGNLDSKIYEEDPDFVSMSVL